LNFLPPPPPPPFLPSSGPAVLGQGLLLPNQWTLKKGEAPPRPLPPFLPSSGPAVLGQGLLLPNQWTLKKGEAPPRPLPPFALAKARGWPKQKGSSDKGCSSKGQRMAKAKGVLGRPKGCFCKGKRAKAKEKVPRKGKGKRDKSPTRLKKHIKTIKFNINI
jgi:hypothetical protein